MMVRQLCKVLKVSGQYLFVFWRRYKTGAPKASLSRDLSVLEGYPHLGLGLGAGSS